MPIDIGGGNTVGYWHGRRKESSSGATKMEAPETAAQCATRLTVGRTVVLVACKAVCVWLSGFGAVPFQAGVGIEDGVLADLSLDRTIGYGAKKQDTVYRRGAMGAELQAGMIPEAGRLAEWRSRAKGQTGTVEKYKDLGPKGDFHGL